MTDGMAFSLILAPELLAIDMPRQQTQGAVEVLFTAAATTELLAMFKFFGWSKKWTMR